MIKEQATRNLNNFLSSYTLQESSELLNQVYDQVTKGLPCVDRDDNGENRQILDFLESLEELVPTIYTLHSQRSHLRE